MENLLLRNVDYKIDIKFHAMESSLSSMHHLNFCANSDGKYYYALICNTDNLEDSVNNIYLHSVLLLHNCKLNIAISTSFNVLNTLNVSFVIAKLTLFFPVWKKQLKILNL